MEKKVISPKGMIVFESKYGATQQYAQWLGEELKLPVARPGELSISQLQGFDYLLIGTPVYVGKFLVKKWIKKNLKNILNKKLFFFIVNATAPNEEVKRQQFVLNNIPPEIQQASYLQFLPGRLIYRKLNFFDKLLVKMGAIFEKDPVKKLAMRSDLDAVKKENLMPLINAVNEFYLKNNYRASSSIEPNLAG